MKRFFLFISLFSALNSYAGFVKKNGGDAVVCTYSDKSHYTIKLLETHEANNGFSPMHDSAYDDYSSRVQYFSDLKSSEMLKFKNLMMKNLGEEYFDIYSKVIFASDLFFVSNLSFHDEPIKNLDDSGEMIDFELDPNCSLEQIAFNKRPLFKMQKIFYAHIDANKMSALDQVKLAVHEVLSVCRVTQSDSYDLRYFVNLLFSHRLKSYSIKEIDLIMKNLGIPEGIELKGCFDRISLK